MARNNGARRGVDQVSRCVGATQSQHQRKQSRAKLVNSNSDSFFSFKSPQGLFSHSNRRSLPISPIKKPSHRLSSSVSSPLTGSHSFPPPSTPRNGPSSGHQHKRSISILSIDSEGGGDKTPNQPSPVNRSRPTRGHGRSASLQVLPKKTGSYDDTLAKGICLPPEIFAKI